MRKELVGICALAAFAAAPAALGQECIDVLWCEDFDEYNLGRLIVNFQGQDCDIDTCTDDPIEGCSVGRRWAVWTGGNDDNAASMVVSDPAPGGVDDAVSVDISPGVEDIVFEMFGLPISASKAYKFSIEVYVPDAFVEQVPARDSYVILLNTYPTNINWSSQYHWNSNSQTVVNDGAGGGEVDFVTGAWQKVEIIINLASDRQIFRLFSPDGQSFQEIDKGPNGWTEGVSGGGALTVGGLDLYANDTDVAVLYDGIGICEIPDTGACCEDDGTCAIANQSDCEAGTGFFKGIGSSCDTCEVRGDDGWILDAPFVWDGSGSRTLGPNDDCQDAPFFGGDADETFVVTVPWEQRWNFDACNTSVDVLMAMGTGGQCASERRISLDSPRCPDNVQAFFSDELGAGVVNVTVEGEFGASGDYSLSVQAQCPRLGVDGNDEGEECGEDTNGGCNMQSPNFVTIQCDDTIRGAQFFDGAARDTDWFEFTIDADTEITLTGRSVFSGAVFGVIEDSDTQDCNEVSIISPLATTGFCTSGDRDAVITTVLENTDRDGGDPETTTWWLFAGPTFGGPIAACDEGFEGEPSDPGEDLPADVFGQNGYTMSLTCAPVAGTGACCVPDAGCFPDTTEDFCTVLGGEWFAGEACEDIECDEVCGNPACPADFDFTGDVGFQDLVTLLARWGPCETECCPWDLQAEPDGDVGFQDLVTLLARWGACK